MLLNITKSGIIKLAVISIDYFYCYALWHYVI